MIVLLVATAAVLLAYLLRPPAQRISVPSTVLWQKLVEETSNRRRLWRWLLSFLLSLLIALLLVSVLFRLEPRTGSVVNPVVLIDNTGSMTSLTPPYEGTTRLQAAKQIAFELLDRSTGTITIADLGGTVGPTEVDSSTEARRLVRSIEPRGSQSPRLPEQLLLERKGDSTPIFLITDSSWAQLASNQGLPPQIDGSNVTTLNVLDTSEGETSTRNLGIVHFEENEPDPAALDRLPSSAYLEVINGGSVATNGELVLEAFSIPMMTELDKNQGLRLLARELSVAPGESWSAALDLSTARSRFPGQTVLVRATVKVGASDDPNERANAGIDAQPLDDEAWLVLDPFRSNLAVGRGLTQLPRWLERIVETSDRLQLSRRSSGSASSRSNELLVTVYSPTTLSTASTADSETFSTPCMILPPQPNRVVGASAAANPPSRTGVDGILRIDGAVLSLPGQPALELPWTEVSILTSGSSEDAEISSSGPTWVSGRVSTRDNELEAAATAATVPLITGPRVASDLQTAEPAGDFSGCTTWHFDPLATFLETRAEFPAFVERVIAETAKVQRRQDITRLLGSEDRDLAVAGSRGATPTWVPARSEPNTAAFLTLRQGQLRARPPLGVAATTIRPEPNLASNSGSTPIAESMQDGSPNPLRWPARSTLIIVVLVLLSLEALTRFSGVTE